MSEALPPIRRTIFLDTNALHYVGSYLRMAMKLGLPPHCADSVDYLAVQGTLRGRMPSGIAEGLMKGCRTLAYLQQEAARAEPSEIFTSRMSKAEMLHGILDGQAHARMAREGIPYRMRQRPSELSELVAMRLEPADYKTLRQEVDDLFVQLEERAAMRIGFAESEQVVGPRVVADLCEFLQSRVYMDVLDCWMYACALALQADEVLTYDGSFHRIINSIRQPPLSADPAASDWGLLRTELQAALEVLFGVGTAVALSLPCAPSPPKTTPLPWEQSTA